MTSELDKLSKVIGDIYDAAIDPSLWQETLASICGYVGGYSATLFWHDAATQNAQALYLFNDDPEYTRLYFEKYLPMDPFFPASSFIEAGVVHGANDIIPQAELEKTRFYKEWIAPQGIVDAIAVNLEKGVTRSSFLAIRTDATYGIADDAARTRAASLVPHLQRAVAIGRLFDQSKAVETALTKTLDHIEAGVFLIGVSGRIVFANAAARNILAEGKLLREERQSLATSIPDTNRMLRDVFAAAEKGDTSVGIRGVAIPLSASPEDRWFAHVLPMTSGHRREAGEIYSAIAAVFVRKTSLENPPPLEAIARLYRLTGGEVRVLDAVLKVGSIKGIAEMLGLSQATVKTHLQNVFRKSGTKRQSDLVKLVAGI